ncbi:MAG: DUF1214 domain-containing protein [Proteobacteria bacterium]|nr:DUF1214 domain-containing protein [Pseudomonadota bacterium]
MSEQSGSDELSAQRLLSGRAWDDYCEVLKLAGRAIERFADEPTALDRAEWYRFLTRLTRNGLERFVENCEPERPRLRDAPWRQSINFQSPDQDHLLAEFVDGRHAYVIRGTRGTAPYFVMASWSARQPADAGRHDWAPRGFAGLAECNPALLRTTAMLQSQAIDYDAHGNFSVLVSQEPPEGGRNWLKIDPDCVGLLIRIVYHDRTRETAPQMSIERLDEPAPRPLDAGALSTQLAKSGQLVLAYLELVRTWWQDNLAKRPNSIRFSRALYLSNGGVPDRHHGFGTWQCAKDEALVLQFTPPDCDYWIFQLCNMWQENFDNYEDGQGHVTKYRCRLEPDGSVCVVIAASDPGIGGNWIDPGGHVHGGMSLRLILIKAPPPPVTAYRLPLARLRTGGRAALRSATALVSGEVTD